MVQSSFSITSVIGGPPELKSILETCQSVIGMVGQLVEIDPVFSDFEASSAGSSTCRYKVSAGSTEKQLNAIAENLALDMIEYSRQDIARHDNEPNPTLAFKREIGFNSTLRFVEQGERLRAHFSLGGKFQGVFYIEYLAIKSNRKFTLDWHESIIKGMVDHFDPKYSALLFRTMEFYEEQDEMKLPSALGWISYFKTGVEIDVPDEIKDAVVESYKDGKLVLFSRDEEYFQSLSMDEIRNVVLTGMKKLRLVEKPTD